MQLFLTKEEKQSAELISVKRNNLALQDQLLQKEMDGLISEFCSRNSVDIKNAKTLNLEQGFVEFEEKVKEGKWEGRKDEKKENLPAVVGSKDGKKQSGKVKE